MRVGRHQNMFRQHQAVHIRGCLKKAGMPAWMRMGVMKEYLDLVAHPRIAGAEECEEIKYTKAAKTGAGDTPEILRILLWWALKDVVKK